MSINWWALAKSVEKVLAVVEEVVPLGAIAGPEGLAISTFVASAAKYAEDVLKAATAAAGGVPPASADLASMKASLASLRKVNDGLAAQVAASATG